jgi:hypothetical protein
MADEDKPLDLRFPLQGLDLSTGLNAQRPGTTVKGQNVRSYDAGTLRMRGGNRSGITPFLGAGSTVQVSGDNVVTHLNSIVWVTQAAIINNNTFFPLTMRLNYSETNNPPARDSPVTNTPEQWFANTVPTFAGTSAAIVGTPDGGGTGKGSATFKISTDGTTVTLVCTFVSAGFAGPYSYSGPGQVQTLTQSNASFFNPSISEIAGNWTVIAGSFIGNLFFNIFYSP